MLPKPIRNLARTIEIANYLLLLPATFSVFIFTRPLFHDGAETIWRNSDMLITSLGPIVFFVFGFALHRLYFQVARQRQLLVRLHIIWGLSVIYNVMLVTYFVFFGSFATFMFVWPLCVGILSLVAFIFAYKSRKIVS